MTAASPACRSCPGRCASWLLPQSAASPAPLEGAAACCAPGLAAGLRGEPQLSAAAARLCCWLLVCRASNMGDRRKVIAICSPSPPLLCAAAAGGATANDAAGTAAGLARPLGKAAGMRKSSPCCCCCCDAGTWRWALPVPRADSRDAPATAALLRAAVREQSSCSWRSCASRRPPPGELLPSFDPGEGR